MRGCMLIGYFWCRHIDGEMCILLFILLEKSIRLLELD